MKLKYFLLLTFLFNFSATTLLLAQEINPATVNVEELDDTQINQIINEIEKRGLTQEQAITMAKAQGASQIQINILKARMQEVQMTNGIEQIPDAKETLTPRTQEEQISIKSEIDTTEKLTRIFGFDLFNKENLTFEPSVNLPVPEDYVIGIGDQIIISVWGASEASHTLQVSNNGSINVPGIGPINISGQNYNSIKHKIIQRLTSIYSGMSGDSPNTWADVTLAATRTIRINVVGEANAPGTYIIPATASAFNALYLSGGPNENGSFRKIKVIRNGKTVHTIDVYDFLINANASANIQLREQDIIFIPTYDNRVEVSGEFKRVGYFELLGGETMSELLKITGGFTENAYTNNLTLTRNTNKERKLHDIPNDLFESFILRNGDLIEAGAVIDRYENRVSIDGAVFRPGNYELTDGMMLSYLIKKSEGLREDAYMHRGTITRRQENYRLKSIPFNIREVMDGTNDIELKREDMVTIRSVFDMQEEQIINVYGEVLTPGEYLYSENLTLADVIFRSGGFKESADISYVEISRRLSYEETTQPGQQLSHIFQFSVSRNLELSDKDVSFKILPFDVIYVRRAPGFRNQGTVRITGEIISAGDYSISNKKEKLSDFVNRAGGFTEDAWIQGARLTREIKLTKEDIEMQTRLARLDSGLVVDEIKETKTILIGIELDKILKNPGGLNDLILLPGDELHIPQQLQTVQISGNVMNPVAMAYKPGKKLKYYINSSGGYALHSKKAKTYVRYANGITASTKSFFGFRKSPVVMPGCEIIVSAKPEKETWSAGQWISIGSGLASLAMSFATIANLTR